MCGIAGQVSARVSNESEPLVRAIVDSQYSRGPDNQAVVPVSVQQGHVVLGHNRLSILDLSEAAHQPMHDSEHGTWIVLNGEIYNYVEIRDELKSLGHTFKTTGDCEVLLRAYTEWGTACVSKLFGFFAFVIADPRAGKVWIVRDRFGVKPLYIHHTDTSVTFASSGRVMAKSFGLGPNLAYLHKGVTTWNFDDDSADSQYDGLEMLPPGHMLTVDLSDGRFAVRREQYYDLEASAAGLRADLLGESDARIAERLLATFDSACDIRMRSDVRVAVALSGGLDSASVACTVGPGHKAVRAFSFGDPADAATEGPLAKLIADRAGIGVSFIRPDSKVVMEAFLPTLDAQDAPFVSVSQVAQYLVAQQVRAEGYTVLLGGQGGDEAFMGYRKYFAFVIKELLARKRYAEAAKFGMQVPALLMSERKGLGNYWRHRKRFAGEVQESSFAWPEQLEKPNISLAGMPSWKRQMLDVTKFSLPTLLRYEDRNSMAHSIETRLPFLDHRLIELGLATPERLKVSHGYGKWILRSVMAGRVPDEVRLARYKIGFAVDQRALLAGGLGETLRCLVKDRPHVARQYLKPGVEIDQAFSNEALTASVGAMPELVSLAWLARRF